MIGRLQRVCAKLYAAESEGVGDEVFVSVFHEWIRNHALDAVLLDVADYSHVPDGPGVVLVTHEATYALDRSDGRFGLLVQRRRPAGGDAADAIAAALRGLVAVADKLEADSRLAGELSFDRTHVRIDANDRLRAPSSDAAFEAIQPFVREAVGRVFHNATATVTRTPDGDSRNRLAIDVQLSH